MKWLPTNVGAEPKKLAILGILVVALGGVYWYNSQPDVPAGAATTKTKPAPAKAKAGVPDVPLPPTRSPRVSARAASDDFQPSLDVPEDVELSKVDPTLKLDVLAKVRSVGNVGGKRNLFEFYTPPPPPPPKVNPIKVTEVKPVDTAPAGPVKPPPPPPPPPVPFKYYGYEGRPGDRTRRALFVEGEEVYIKAENETIKDRYKIVRINVNSVEVEDMVAKNRQTLQIVEQLDR